MLLRYQSAKITTTLDARLTLRPLPSALIAHTARLPRTLPHRRASIRIPHTCLPRLMSRARVESSALPFPTLLLPVLLLLLSALLLLLLLPQCPLLLFLLLLIRLALVWEEQRHGVELEFAGGWFRGG